MGQFGRLLGKERAVAGDRRGRSLGRNWKVVLELEEVFTVVVICVCPCAWGSVTCLWILLDDP